MTLLDHVAIGVRLLFAGYILFSFVFRIALIGLKQYRFPGWIPSWMGPRMFHAFYGSALLLELAILYLFLNLDVGGVIPAILIVMVGAVFTGYGLISLKKVGDCGCGVAASIGLARDRSKASNLVIRNCVVFGCGAIVLVFSPAFSSLEKSVQSDSALQSISLIALSVLPVLSLYMFRKLRPA